MSELVAALPMYDWPELREETDAQWAAMRDALRQAGVDAPDALTRHDAAAGELDLAALWRHPKLLFSQTCWGPMQAGLQQHVRVLAQPAYSRYEGGEGEDYSSAIVMRGEGAVPAPADGRAVLPLDLMRGRRFVFNSHDSMSGFVGIARDLDAAGQGFGSFSAREETGSHRASGLAVAEGRADVAAIDCRTWALFKRFEPQAAARLKVVGWTARRKGLPYITAAATPEATVAVLRAHLPA